MRKLSRKLFIACLAVAFAVIALGTSTYAWLVVSKTTTVGTIEAQVKAGDGSIEISKNGQDGWKNNLSEDDFATELAGFNFGDATYDGTDFKSIKFNLSGETPSTSLEAITDKKASGILVLEFYVRLNADSQEGSKALKLDLGNSALATSGNKSWTPDLDVTDDANIKENVSTEAFEVANAARIMIEYGNEAAKIFENNKEALQTKTATTGAMGYLKARTGIPADGTGIEENTGTYETQSFDVTTPVELGTVSKETATKVTVTVWLEGFDKDCINALYNQMLQIKLALAID